MESYPSLDHEAWSAWHPKELADRLAGIGRQWCVVGGWALDLWHGRETREHEDLEFTVLRDDVPFFRERLKDMRFHAVGGGVVQYLQQDREPPEDLFQIWCEDIAAQCWRADMMIEPGTPETWVYKRDPRISAPRAEMVAKTVDGIPYLRPAAILLFKAKYQRPKDEVDFDNAVVRLTESERVWLRNCLDLLHPGHAWSERLSAGI